MAESHEAVVHCLAPVAEEVEEAGAEAETAEPEVIAKRKAEEVEEEK